MSFVDMYPVPCLVDLYVLKEVFVGLDLYGGMIALGDKDFCSAVDLDVLKITDLAIFCPDIAVAMNPFSKDTLTGGEEERDGEEPGEPKVGKSDSHFVCFRFAKIRIFCGTFASP